jgi:hypothetical protein
MYMHAQIIPTRSKSCAFKLAMLGRLVAAALVVLWSHEPSSRLHHRGCSAPHGEFVLTVAARRHLLQVCSVSLLDGQVMRVRFTAHAFGVTSIKAVELQVEPKPFEPKRLHRIQMENAL